MKPTLLAAALAALLPCLALAAPVSFAEAEAQVATTAGQRDPYAHYALAQRYMERHAPGSAVTVWACACDASMNAKLPLIVAEKRIQHLIYCINDEMGRAINGPAYS